MTKKGDTLVEVCIAIGIFSLIAIGVASVMSSGTAGSQTALETTLAREEIDAQADALRFVHESYINAKNSSSDPSADPYYNLWKQITDKAITASSAVTQYNPETCDKLYDPNTENNIFKQHAFVLNIKQLSNPSQALISTTSTLTSNKFAPAGTYPRLIFGNATSNSDTDNLVNSANNNNSNLYRAEGLYAIAVRDEGTDMIVEGDRTTSTPAFYDFYIRSCWYGVDANRPTSISTVMRLYDPPSTVAAKGFNKNYIRFNYLNNDPTAPAPTLPYSFSRIYAGETRPLANPKVDINYSKWKHRFLCWGTIPRSCEGEHYDPDQEVSVPADLPENRFVYLYANWNTNPFNLIFDANGGRFNSGSTPRQSVVACNAFGSCETTTFAFPSSYSDGSGLTSPDTKKYIFSGWSIDSPTNKPEYGGVFGRQTINPIKKDTVFYAIWKPYYWVDVNVFMNQPYGGQSTGGYADFKFKLYINGILQEKDHSGNPAPYIDFYRELPDNSNIKVLFSKNVPAGYRIINLGTICQTNKLGNTCRTSETSTDYVVEFTVDESLKSDTVDSSGHYSVQIEPVWKKQ